MQRTQKFLRIKTKKLCKLIFFCLFFFIFLWFKSHLGKGKNLHLRHCRCCLFRGRLRRARKRLSMSRLRRCFRRTIQVACNPGRKWRQCCLRISKFFFRTYFVNVSSLAVEQSKRVSSWHESLFNVAQFQGIQRQHVFLFLFVFVLIPWDAFRCQHEPVRSRASC